MSISMVELNFEDSPPEIYCPVCGIAIYADDKSDESSKCEHPNCKHLVFSYVDICDGFQYVAPYLQKQVESVFENEETEDDPVKALLNQMESNSILCYSITTSGMACGPVSSTVIVAFDFCPSQELEKE